MTDFIETNALLAVLSGNVDEARLLVDSMLPGEKAELLAGLYKLSDIVRNRCVHCHHGPLADDGSCRSCAWYAERNAAAEARRAEEAKREASGGKR